MNLAREAFIQKTRLLINNEKNSSKAKNISITILNATFQLHLLHSISIFNIFWNFFRNRKTIYQRIIKRPHTHIQTKKKIENPSSIVSYTIYWLTINENKKNNILTTTKLIKLLLSLKTNEETHCLNAKWRSLSQKKQLSIDFCLYSYCVCFFCLFRASFSSLLFDFAPDLSITNSYI